MLSVQFEPPRYAVLRGARQGKQRGFAVAEDGFVVGQVQGHVHVFGDEAFDEEAAAAQAAHEVADAVIVAERDE